MQGTRVERRLFSREMVGFKPLKYGMGQNSSNIPTRIAAFLLVIRFMKKTQKSH